MDRYYVPHDSNGPLTFSINGHDLLLIGPDPEVFEDSALFQANGYQANGLQEEQGDSSEEDLSDAIELKSFDIEVAEQNAETADIALFDAVELEDFDQLEETEDEDIEQTKGPQERIAEELALRFGSGVVIIPSHASLDDLLQSLESELPWCH